MTKIKICGVTCADDAQVAADAGADAVGMVCHAEAPRRIGVATALRIAATLPSTVRPVLLFVDAPQEKVSQACAALPQAWLQFHGAETPEYCASFARPYFKSCVVHSATDIDDAMRDHRDARAIVADAGAGSGAVFAWDLVPEPNKRALPLVLAGGLDATNVAAAIDAAAPEYVDVSSGVCRNEDPLRKDPAKIKAFINEVRRADVS